MDEATLAQIEGWVRSFIAPFTDASSVLKVTPQSATAVRVEGRRRFQEFDLLLQAETGADQAGRLVAVTQKRQIPLKTVLSGATFADLDALAKSMIPYLKGRLGTGHVVDSRVSSEASEAEAAIGQPASRAISSALIHGTSRTRLTFLHGHAGAGKSWMLMKACLTQTHQFLTRKEGRLDLYIDAQGVNLRSLEQQIARQLDIYNGVLRYPEVVPLARLGVLGLVIDGFDELITPSGSNDTLRALYRYLADFDGQGAVVASARTSFFYLRDLSAPQIAEEAYVAVDTLEVLPWGDDEWVDYCSQRSQPGLIDSLRALADQSAFDRTLLGRPFVVAEIAKIAERSGGPLPSGDLLAVIEAAFVSRERLQKLVDPDQRIPGSEDPLPILTAEQFGALLMAVAEEMWCLRQNTLDVATLKTLASMWAEEWHLGREHRNILVDRIDANALLEPAPGGSGERRVQFPHEMFFARTLARVICVQLASDLQSAASLLRLAPLSITAAEQVADLAKGASVGVDARAMLQLVARLGMQLRLRSDEDGNARINAASLACELLRVQEAPADGIELRYLHFSKAAFRGAKLGGLVLAQCSLSEIDARAAEWNRVTFLECDEIVTMHIEPGQLFHTSLPDVHHLIVHWRDREPEDIFGTRPSRRFLVQAPAAPVPGVVSEQARAVARVVDALARRAQRMFWFSPSPEDTDDRNILKLKNSDAWAETIALLGAHGFIEWSTRSRSGVRAKLFHFRNADKVIAARKYEDREPGSAASRFWEAVEELE